MAEALGRGRPVVSRCQLVEAIQQLGYLPRQGKNSTIEDKRLAVRLIRARTAGLLSSKQEAALGKLAEGAADKDLRKAWEARKLQAEAVRTDKAEEMMQEVRGFGRYPMESRQDVGERQRADKLRKARKAKRFSPAQEAELQVLQQAARDARAEARIAQAEGLMQQKRCDARKAKKFSSEQDAELKALQQAEKDSSEKARQGGGPSHCEKRKR